MRIHLLIEGVPGIKLGCHLQRSRRDWMLRPYGPQHDADGPFIFALCKNC